MYNRFRQIFACFSLYDNLQYASFILSCQCCNYVEKFFCSYILNLLPSLNDLAVDGMLNTTNQHILNQTYLKKVSDALLILRLYTCICTHSTTASKMTVIGGDFWTPANF